METEEEFLSAIKGHLIDQATGLRRCRFARSARISGLLHVVGRRRLVSGDRSVNAKEEQRKPLELQSKEHLLDQALERAFCIGRFAPRARIPSPLDGVGRRRLTPNDKTTTRDFRRTISAIKFIEFAETRRAD